MTQSINTQTDALHMDEVESREAYEKYNGARKALGHIELEWNQQLDTQPQFYACVNHRVLNNQNIKTDTFSFIQEKNIYTPELEVLLLNFMRQCGAELQKEENINGAINLKSDFYKRQYENLDTFIKGYIQGKIQASPIQTMTDQEFMVLVEPILTPDRLVYLKAIIKEKTLLAPILEKLQSKNPEALIQIDFIKDLDILIENQFEGDKEHLFYTTPVLQKLAAIFNQFSNKELNSMLRAYEKLYDKNGEAFEYKLEILKKLTHGFLENYRQKEEEDGAFAFEPWGYYLMASSTFGGLDATEKKDLIYTILKNYSHKHRSEASWDLIIPKICTQLYTKKPELLEYRSVSVLLELLKNPHSDPSKKLIEEMKPLIAQIPDLPSWEQEKSIKTILGSKNKNEPNYLYDNLMPIFEAVMVQQMLKGGIKKSVSSSKKPHKV